MRLIMVALILIMTACSKEDPEELHFNFGKVSLENSGSSAAQQSFLQGLAALHSFEYKEAQIDFKRAQKLDPNFALAYWGEAMSYTHPVWRQQYYKKALEVMKRLGKTPEARSAKAKLPLEKDLVGGLEVLYGEGTKEERDQKYADYMAKVYAKYPNNLEVLSLYSLAILGTIHPNEPTFRKAMMAAAVLDAVVGFNANQDMLQHPGLLHYYIHAMDDPIHAPLALKAADLYEEVAPDAAHAVHMPSHIYVQNGLWDKARESNQRSYDASKRWVDLRKQELSDREFHSLYWLMYANLQTGRYAEAKKDFDDIWELAKTDTACSVEGHWALMGARYMVETKSCALPFDLEQMRIMKDCYVSDEPQVYSYVYGLGYCALRHKNFANATIAIRELEQLRDDLKSGVRRSGAISNEKEQEFRMNILTISIEELLAIRDQIDDNLVGAIDRLEPAAKLEASMALPNGIPVPVQSALELYGTFLLQDKQYAKAKEAFSQALERVPNRAKSYLGMALALEGLGDQQAAQEYAKKALAVWTNSDTPFPEKAEAKRLAGEEGKEGILLLDSFLSFHSLLHDFMRFP